MPSAPAGMQRLLQARERGVVGREDALAFQRSLHFPAHFASKLSVEHTYEGHQGCVNRLGWNADGSLLVSGSDDRRAIIWHYPDVERPPLALSTEHRANIFGCQFLPCTGDRRIVTGAMDDTVQLHDMETSPAAAAVVAAAARAAGRQGDVSGGGGHPMHRRSAAATSHLRLVTPLTKVYNSHKDRVKDVKVEAMNPHNFWSGGEDGDVRQYDTRVPNQDKWESPTVLVQVRDGHRTVQVKSLDINKVQPHLMAVAGSDPYIRLYDRRKLGTGNWKRRGATPAVMLLAPPHLPLAAAAARHGRSHATYVAFSNRGDKVVTTYHGDHAYCFDVTAAGDLAAMFPQPAAAPPRQLPGRPARLGALLRGGGGGGGGAAVAAASWAAAGWGSPPAEGPPPGSASGSSGRSGGGGSSVPLPPRAEEAKARGNGATFERRWAAAVRAFSEALYFAPGAPVLYALRAEALLRRGWVGDAAVALRDCDTATALDEGCSRAFLSRIHALQALQQYQCALTAVEEYRHRFPGRAADDVAKLAAQLRASLEERRRLYEARRQQQERRRVQRAVEALARTPRRVGTSPPPRSRRPRTESTGTVADTGAPEVTTPARRDAAHEPGAAGGATATAEPISNGATLSERLESDDAAAMDVAEPYIGPPPPPPPYPGEDIAAAYAAAAATGASSVAEPLDPTTDGAEAMAAAVATVAAAANGFAPASGGSAAATASPGACSGGAVPPGSESAPPGLATALEVAEAGLEGVWEEEEEEVEIEREEEAAAAVVAAGDPVVGRRRRGHEEEEEAVPLSHSDDEYGSDDDEYDDMMLSRRRDGAEEEDPDLELFLEFYARAMERAGGGSGGSGGGGAGGRAPSASPRSPFRGPQGGGGSSSSWSAAPPAARHVPGAWGGSPGGRRMLQRYVGQCNVQTDIKEVNFVGSDDRLVAAGSDCGRVFLYDADSGAVLRALPADEDVANCVQCHPTLPVLATSGIENVIRLWAPRDALPAAAAVSELEEELANVVERNQSRMKEGPTVFRPSVLQTALQENPQLLRIFMSQLYGRGAVAGRSARAGAAGLGSADGGDPGGEGTGGGGGGGEDDDDDDDEDDEGHPGVSCRMA